MKKPPDASKVPYEVGFGKPPKHTRFQKGTSGNPNGRRRGVLNLATTFNRALKETVTVTEGGRRKTITKLEGALKIMINKALKGDARALQQLIALGPLVGIEQPTNAAAIDANDAAVMEMLLKRFGSESIDDPPTDAS